jgi:two-component system, chemotaxis family, sensor kinase CheA
VVTRDPYKYFRIEARELVGQLAKGVLDLEKGSSETDLVARLLRLAHTLKGAARVVKQPGIADLSHAVEDALAPLREGSAALPHESMDGVLSLLDAISVRVAGLAEVVAADGPAARPLAAGNFSMFGPGIEDMDALLDGVIDLNVQLGKMRCGVTSLKHVRHLSQHLSERLTLPRGFGEETQLATDKTRSMAHELCGLVASTQRDFAVAVDQLDRELRQVRETTERLRLLPARLIFNSLERALRDAAQSVGTRVLFETKGGEVRLEPHVLSTMQDALVQVMRNAAAHGIEPPAERAAAGKPVEGHVRLEVLRRGNRLSFACTDDGRGVDAEAVRRAAQRHGMAVGDAERLRREELLRLVLKGGITTSSAVTEVSGRGIGLDVVREAATRLGGEVTIRSDAGKGTTVEVVIPVSLSSLDALLVETAGQAAAIPLSAIHQAIRFSALGVTKTAGAESILLEGKAIPFTALSQALRPRAATAPSPETWSAVVIESRGVLAAIGVDRLLGVESIVLRPLPKLFPPDAIVAGASLDAEGNPQMVLDPEGLVAAARRGDDRAQVDKGSSLPILIIDDSLTTRMLEQSILESAGYEVELATSAEEGLEKARLCRYGLFLVDVEMPGMDGFDFIRRTRLVPSLQDIPAILVTSRCSAEDRQQGEDVGAQGYVVKGEFDQGELLERIRRLVE